MVRNVGSGDFQKSIYFSALWFLTCLVERGALMCFNECLIKKFNLLRENILKPHCSPFVHHKNYFSYLQTCSILYIRLLIYRPVPGIGIISHMSVSQSNWLYYFGIRGPSQALHNNVLMLLLLPKLCLFIDMQTSTWDWNHPVFFKPDHYYQKFKIISETTISNHFLSQKKFEILYTTSLAFFNVVPTLLLVHM